jgi:hypothetical protein
LTWPTGHCYGGVVVLSGGEARAAAFAFERLFPLLHLSVQYPRCVGAEQWCIERAWCPRAMVAASRVYRVILCTAGERAVIPARSERQVDILVAAVRKRPPSIARSTATSRVRLRVAARAPVVLCAFGARALESPPDCWSLAGARPVADTPAFRLAQDCTARCRGGGPRTCRSRAGEWIGAHVCGALPRGHTASAHGWLRCAVPLSCSLARPRQAYSGPSPADGSRVTAHRRRRRVAVNSHAACSGALSCTGDGSSASSIAQVPSLSTRTVGC